MPARPSLAVLMDPLETIKPAKDSTIAMLIAASRRDCDAWCFGQGDLSVRDGRAIARLTPIEVKGTGKDKDWYRTGEAVVRELAGQSTPCSCARTRPSTWNTSTRRTCSSGPSARACWSSIARRGSAT